MPEIQLEKKLEENQLHKNSQPHNGSISQDKTPTASKIKENGARFTDKRVQHLLQSIQQGIEEDEPADPIHYIVNFLCKNYPENLYGFDAVWNGDRNLEKDRLAVVDFFKMHKLPCQVASHFVNAGYDTLDTLCAITPESLAEVEQYNKAQWLPGHKVRIMQCFADISRRVHNFKTLNGNLMKGNCCYSTPMYNHSVTPSTKVIKSEELPPITYRPQQPKGGSGTTLFNYQCAPCPAITYTSTSSTQPAMSESLSRSIAGSLNTSQYPAHYYRC